MRNGNTSMNVAIKKQEKEVLILPMRNGNRDLVSTMTFDCAVLILPMRNGNNKIGIKSFDDLNVLILPMRNGNT